MTSKQVARTLTLVDFNAIIDESKAILLSDSAKGTGAWTPAQVIEHVALLAKASVEGFPTRPPLPIRLIGPLFKRRFLKRSFNPGITLPGSMDYLLPDPAVTGPEAVEHLESAIAKGRAEGFIPASPLFGKLTAAQWEQLHCRHAEMHFGMVIR